MTLRPSAPAPTFVPEGLWEVDAECSSVRFSVKHLLVATVDGAFGDVAGALSSDGHALRAAGSVQVASIHTGVAVRDERLRGPGFFDAERHPVIRFRATGGRCAGDGTWIVPGELELCGATHPLTFTARVSEAATGPVIHAHTSLSRRRHGLDWPGLNQAGRAVVGDRVSIELELVLR